MAEREIDAAEGKEKSYKPSHSKPEHTVATSSKAASQPQSPSLTNAVPDMASSIGSEENSNYCEALEATLEALQSRAQRLVDKINEGRTKDQELMKSFNESLAMKVTEVSQRLEERMYILYDCHNNLLQDRLQELSETVDRIRQVQAELKTVCETVVNLYRDLCVLP
ncbi:synaptonemal complex central element protein 2 [Pelobates fuscus]|uniref:synaptonemal complex central element protein 2 n=1 Tax=Pelobates fuscus TaxID=191477 RepID=UPI002FE4A1B5